MSQPTTAKKSPTRAHNVIKASEWQRITAKYSKADDAQRAKYRAAERNEVDVTDLRDQIVGIVAETFGKQESGWHEIQARGAAHWTTLRNWDMGRVQRPQVAKMREVALTCGYDLKFTPLDAEKEFNKALLLLIRDFDSLDDAEIKSRLRKLAEVK